MSIPDLVNAAFEFGGALAIGASVLRLVKDKQVHGVSLWMIGFFTSWGLWNLFYYPHLGQTWSFVAGIVVLLANLAYLSLLIHYSEEV